MIRLVRRLCRPLLLLALLGVAISACGGRVDSGPTRVSATAMPVPIVMSAATYDQPLEATARSDAQPTTGPTPPTAHSTHASQEQSNLEPTYDIEGYITVTGGSPRARPCTPSGDAADGGGLVVKDQDGRVLGEPSPALGLYRTGSGCAVPYLIEDVPRVETYNFYLLANPREVYASYSFEEMMIRGWTLDFKFPIK